jgi:uncharacterized protein YndB with AHSA1/START domain
MTVRDDLANRSSAIHWPAGFAPTGADLFSHNEGIVNASCERVWKHIVEAVKWPEWYPNAKDVRIGGDESALSGRSVFTWTTFGLPIESRVNEFVPFSQIGWFGAPLDGSANFYHTWFLTQTDTGCHLVTEEVGNGASAQRLRKTDEGLMHRGHDLWIATLKWIAESR